MEIDKRLGAKWSCDQLAALRLLSAQHEAVVIDQGLILGKMVDESFVLLGDFDPVRPRVKVT